jgi:hypothetical protein
VPGTATGKLIFGAGAGLSLGVPSERVGLTIGAHWTSIQTQGGATVFIPVRAGLTLLLR